MEREIAEVVREHSWYVADTYDGSPPFLYTIGLLQSWSHPELVLFGLEPSKGHRILSTIVREIRNGQTFREAGSYSDILKGDLQVGIRRVDPSQHAVYLGYAMGYVRFIDRIGELEAVQVFWPDKTGKFPYDVGCSLDVVQCQPRLDLALTPSDTEQ